MGLEAGRRLSDTGGGKLTPCFLAIRRGGAAGSIRPVEARAGATGFSSSIRRRGCSRRGQTSLPVRAKLGSRRAMASSFGTFLPFAHRPGFRHLRSSCARSLAGSCHPPARMSAALAGDRWARTQRAFAPHRPVTISAAPFTSPLRRRAPRHPAQRRHRDLQFSGGAMVPGRSHPIPAASDRRFDRRQASVATLGFSPRDKGAAGTRNPAHLAGRLCGRIGCGGGIRTRDPRLMRPMR